MPDSDRNHVVRDNAALWSEHGGTVWLSVSYNVAERQKRTTNHRKFSFQFLCFASSNEREWDHFVHSQGSASIGINFNVYFCYSNFIVKFKFESSWDLLYSAGGFEMCFVCSIT